MTPHGRHDKVGVKALRDHLSEHLDRVEGGAELVVTRRGRPIARLSAIGGEGSFHALVRRGLVTLPPGPRSARRPRVKPKDSVSGLVADQRR
jgi:antitoxin (DNA-binding transcriptional repressor) of toxin-antitoxin stability system